MNIETWLNAVGLEQYTDAFLENDIDDEVLLTLTAEDLRDLGIKSVGHRRKILNAIEALTNEAPGEVMPQAPSPIAPSTAERRQLTVLFCDLVGSTELSNKLDPEDLADVIRAYQDACKTNVDRWGGYIAKYLGDGVLAYFGYPVAHEDDAERSVRAGLDMMASVGKISIGNGALLSARVGVATGLVMVGELIGEGSSQEEAVVGETPNLAARLEGLAKPGTVAIAPQTQQLLGNLFEIEDLGRQNLKGFSEPIAVSLITGSKSSVSRFEARSEGRLTPLVGREHEMALLDRLWARSVDGEGQVALISGEAGIGKSRILEAFRVGLTEQIHAQINYQCSPFHIHSALHPVIEQWERAAVFENVEKVESKLDKLEALLNVEGADRDISAASVAALLGLPTDRYQTPDLSPEHRKERTLSTLVDHVERVSRRQPMLLLFEDLHWIDPTSLDFLDRLIERIEHLPVLAILTYRLEFQPRWIGLAHVHAVTLNRLGKGQCKHLIQRLTDDKALPAEVASLLLEKADGVPLFLEELTKTVLESDILSGSKDHLSLRGDLTDVQIPSSLHDSLLARLDHLSSAKEIAQIGAVIGRDFSYSLLAAISPLPEHQLQDLLDQLTDSELIFRRGTPPEATYTFKHALVQDTAYQSLLRSRRRQLHIEIAKALEKSDRHMMPEILAMHLHQGGDFAAATRHWAQAGDDSLARSAQAEAAAHYSKALDALSQSPHRDDVAETELSLLLRLGQAQFGSLGGAAKTTRATYERASELARAKKAYAEQCVAQYGLWIGLTISGEIANSLKVAQGLVELGQGTDQIWMPIVADRLLGTSKYLMGNLTEAQSHLEDVLASKMDFRSVPLPFGHDPFLTAPSTLCHVEWSLGYPVKARERSEASIQRISQGSNNPNTLSYALVWDLLLALLCRDIERARRTADWLGEHAELTGAKFWRSVSICGVGGIAILDGDPQHGLPILTEGMEAFTSTGALQHLPLFKALETEGHLQLDQDDEGLHLLEEMHELIIRTDQLFYLPEVHRLQGLFTASIDQKDEAEEHLREAVKVARQQRSRSWELRSLISLTRILQGQAHFDEARSNLRAVYDCLEKGHGLPDLATAADLLA